MLKDLRELGKWEGGRGREGEERGEGREERRKNGFIMKYGFR
jgi:hypothetical protein